MPKDYKTLVDRYTLKKQEPAEEKKIITHQCFDVRPRNLFVPTELQDEFYESYVAYVKKQLKKGPEALDNGPNCLTERVSKTFKFFVDLDLKPEHFDDKRYLSVSDIPMFMRDVIDTFISVLVDAYGIPETDLAVWKAFRMAYKAHIYFPDIVTDKKKATCICEHVVHRLKSEYPWLSESKAIDTSVYNSGIRMLYSHKGTIGSKVAVEKEWHEKTFADIPYVHYYRLGDLQEDSSISYETDFDKDHLTSISIIVPKDTPSRDFKKGFLNVTPQTTATTTTDDMILDAECPPYVDHEMPDAGPSGVAEPYNAAPLPSHMQTTEIFNDDNDRHLTDAQKLSIRSYVNRELAKLGLQTVVPADNIGFLSKFNNCLGVLVPPQFCPIANRWHKRSSERAQSANYIILNPFECSLRCFKCQDKKVFSDPDDDVKLILQSLSNDYYLKKSLYRRTHETVAHYIFTIVKQTFAASPCGKNGYLWYYYDHNLHRWEQYEKIVSTIMGEDAVIQRSYDAFIRNLKETGPQKEYEAFLGLWKELRDDLQNFIYVKNGLMPVLARKLDFYWSHLNRSRIAESTTFQSRLDTNPKLLGCTNGVWDLARKKFRAGRPEDFISLSTQLDWKPFSSFDSEIRSGLLDFLMSIFATEERCNYVLVDIAKGLDGTPSRQKFFIWTGAGANGKSTLIRLLNLAFGDYAGEVNITLFTKPRPSSNQPLPELIAIKGRRFVSCSEPNSKDTLNLSIVKWLTGGDRITAAAKFESNQSFYLQCTWYCLTNDIPPINASSDDYGTWRRMEPIPFTEKFVEKPTKAHEHPADPNVNENLNKWKEAFLSLLIEMFTHPPTVVKPEEFERAFLQLQKTNDYFARFIAEFLEKDSDYFREKTGVYTAFKCWLKNGLGYYKPVTFDSFEKAMCAEHMLGPLVEDENGNKGWCVNFVKAIPENVSSLNNMLHVH